MVDELAVWLGGKRVGALRRGRRTSVEFSADAGAPTISAGQSQGDWTSERATAWFEGLLPEGETRTRMAARFGVTETDTYGLLEAIGWECAGAVSVLPEGRHPGSGTYRELSDQDVSTRLDALPGRPYDEDAALRASLGGIQSKLVLAWRGGAWLEPLDGAPSTYILKPEPEAWSGMATAEAWALRVASVATPAATAQIRLDLGSRPVLVVTRFDRRGDDPIERIHQEDLCQLLGLPPSSKYAEPPPKPWKPSLQRLASILLSRSADPPAELERLLQQVIVSVALGNADAHGKNLAVLHVADELVSLAPMYDVVPTMAFLPRQTHAALPIGGRYRLAEIGAEQVLAEARSWGIPERVARQTLDATIAAIGSGIEVADSACPSVPEKVRLLAARQFERLAASAVSSGHG